MNKCLIITGAAGELGQHVVRTSLARADIDTIFVVTRRRRVGISDPRIIELCNVDLTRESDILRMSKVSESLHNVRIGLIHCAGSFPKLGVLHKSPLSLTKRIFAENVLSFIGATRAIIPAMRRNGCGGILAFTSHTQSAAYPFMGPFNLSKTALLSAVQTIANENSRFSIAANALAIATLQTETERNIKPTGAFADWVPAEEVARFAADLVLFGSAAVNGSEIQFWRHSDSFFGRSVFDRNSIHPQKLDPDDG